MADVFKEILSFAVGSVLLGDRKEQGDITSAR